MLSVHKPGVFEEVQALEVAQWHDEQHSRGKCGELAVQVPLVTEDGPKQRCEHCKNVAIFSRMGYITRHVLICRERVLAYVGRSCEAAVPYAAAYYIYPRCSPR